MKIKIITFVLAILFVAIPTLAQDAKSTVSPVEAKKSIEVTKFDIKEGVEFPAAALDVMTNEIVDELIKLKKFSQVKLTAPASPTTTDNTEKVDSSETQLLLTGTITKYEAGSRAKRYLIGFGAGKTKVVAAIKVSDKTTGTVLLEKNVDGKVIMGIFGGDSNGSTRGLAKEVASTTKKALFK